MTIFKFAKDTVKTTIPNDCEYVPLHTRGFFRDIGNLLFLFPLSSSSTFYHNYKTTVTSAMKKLFYDEISLTDYLHHELILQTCPCEISYLDPESITQPPINFEPFGVYYGQQIMMCIFIKNGFNPEISANVRTNFWKNIDQYRITQENLLFYFNSELFRSPLFKKLAPFAKKMMKLCMEKNINFVCDRGEFVKNNFKLKQYQKDKLSNDEFFVGIQESLRIVCDAQF